MDARAQIARILLENEGLPSEVARGLRSHLVETRNGLVWMSRRSKDRNGLAMDSAQVALDAFDDCVSLLYGAELADLLVTASEPPDQFSQIP